jgi:hypothetical protein
MSLKSRVQQGLDNSMDEIADRIFEQSQAQVPVDKGELRASGRKEVHHGPNASIEISYHTPYAAVVHENTHNKHPHGKAHYLSDPLKAHIPDITRIMVNEIKKELRR